MSWSNFFTAKDSRLKGSCLTGVVGAGVGSVVFMNHLYRVFSIIYNMR